MIPLKARNRNGSYVDSFVPKMVLNTIALLAYQGLVTEP
jgi:hypothetical protein